MLAYTSTIGFDLSSNITWYEIPADGESDLQTNLIEKINKDKFIPAQAFSIFRELITEIPSDHALLFEPQVCVSIPTPPPERY